MKNYTYQNSLIGKKHLRQLLAWSFTNYDSMQACLLADELKYLGFKYASQSGISISIEDLKIPFVKNLMLERANQEILNSEKLRNPKEFVNHKILDCIGDLYTSGYRIIGSVNCSQGGHFLTNQILKKVFENKENFSIIEIQERNLPHTILNKTLLRSIA